MNWYALWKYKTWIAIAVLLFICMGQLAYTNKLSGQLFKADAEKDSAVAKAIADTAAPYIKAQATAEAKARKASEDYEKLKSEQRVKTETITREVQKIVERPVYLNVCFDGDGVSAINRLITNTR